MNSAQVTNYCAECERLARALDAAEKERDEERSTLRRLGAVPCDIPACNCGSWHLPRLNELRAERDAALAEAAEQATASVLAINRVIRERDEARAEVGP